MNIEPTRPMCAAEGTTLVRKAHGTWQTVFTGENLPVEECLHLLRNLSIVPSESALRMIEMVCRGGESEVRPTRLVIKTPAEFGFRRHARTAVVDEFRKTRGLVLCPPDTAFALRRCYVDLPKDETVRVMSKPIVVNGLPCIFAVTRHTRDIILDAVEYLDDYLLMPHERLIYAKPDEPVRSD
jgi:hypothetical protein